MTTRAPTLSPRVTRRSFLQHSALAGAALAFPAVLRSASPNSRVQVAAIGVDGQGYSDLHNVAGHAKAKFVGFCDVDLNRFARADKAVPGVPHFQDFRVMLEKLSNTVDAVIVSTPDHMHALIAIEAMKRGKHVYCQKPLAHNVWESRQMRLWAEKKNLVTQMGNHIHSAVEYRMSARLLREGAIGKVKEVYSWVGVTGNERTRLLEPPAPGPVPTGFDWNLWIGCAPMRPYTTRLPGATGRTSAAARSATSGVTSSTRFSPRSASGRRSPLAPTTPASTGTSGRLRRRCAMCFPAPNSPLDPRST